MRALLLLAALAAIGLAIAVSFAWLRPAPATVRADRGSIAVGGNVGRDVIVNEFDAEAERKDKAVRFVRNAHRVCQSYLKTLSELSPDAPTATANRLTFDFNGLYYTPDLAAVVGPGAYATLGRAQKELQKMSGDLLQAHLEFRGRQAAADAPERQTAAQKYDAIRTALAQRTQSHCQYLLTLSN